MSGNSSNRPRINSRDIVRSYSGLFGRDGDLMPFELARSEHTDWVEKGGFLLLGTYVGCICLFQIVVLAVLDSYNDTETLKLHLSWTVTNAIHCLVTTIYVHWLKGSMFDEHGELAAMTLWEQLEGRSRVLNIKRTLFVVPTVLCYAACHFSNYSYAVCVTNVILWILQMMGKFPFMNGVRIFGINRTTGIDDNYECNNDDNGHNAVRIVSARSRRRRGCKHD
mmetsp:Transcript_17848/g.36679  ORF Transcript_17848/g.36679 Transcript_17848/m.36679 type:complete len:223 (-) Transcript_17848:611-1279(-)|eukprot:CAMPEP_0201130334 /NCGR_PEP_ID=MMETSP0850-20130426/39555_1 /ASSEMBLY_ACC=CAM_ASM_000622 /TAXON_ID=183588 /ORGANISM="Pseudo-nitzschia fraudulenta, Strain WWA7" /LENGTH=222 /DNA_ID=CAMNT_0047400077 /DNA_START=221 /DNA_END=889 /DNA_ORIENTATION=-